MKKNIFKVLNPHFRVWMLKYLTGKCLKNTEDITYGNESIVELRTTALQTKVKNATLPII